jgi:hypothetical protein
MAVSNFPFVFVYLVCSWRKLWEWVRIFIESGLKLNLL